MALPPISGSNGPEFVNPYTHIGNVADKLATSLEALSEAITTIVNQRIDPSSKDVLEIAEIVRSIQQISDEVDRSIGDPNTVQHVKNCIQAALDVLSNPEASIIDPAKKGPVDPTHLQKTLDTFIKLPFAAQVLARELTGIASEIKVDRPRRIG